MDGLSFTTITRTPTDPARMDVACFVGYVGRRNVRPRDAGESDRSYLKQLPEWLRRWFEEYNWRPGQAGRRAEDLIDLLDVPVPVDTWEVFDELYAWDARPLDDSGRPCDTMMGAAVRRFFSEGGRTCYVVRVGDPWTALAPAETRAARAADYLAVLPPPSPVDRRTWRGIGHLFGLSDVSILCLPDLPDLFSTPPSTLPSHREEVPAERFIECADRTVPGEASSLRRIPPPGCDARGFGRWANLVDDVATFLSRYAREVQFVAAVPLPIDERALVGQLAPERTLRAARRRQIDAARGIHSRFVQLVYPWVRTRDSGMLPGDLEAPDGVLSGLLAANALRNGTWTNMTRRPAQDVRGLEPVPDREILHQPFGPPVMVGLPERSYRFRERVSVLSPSHRGVRLLSDVTTAGGTRGPLESAEPYRAANVNRLLASILRAARLMGEEIAFENNGEALWSRLRESLESFLSAIWADGALAGVTSSEAFNVRCDRSTMTQADIDAGRVIVRLTFTAAMPIVHVAVVLAMEDGGQVSLVSPGFSAVTAA